MAGKHSSGQHSYEQPSERSGGGKKKKILIIILIAVVLIGAGVAFALTHNNASKNTTASVTPTATATAKKFTEPFYVLLVGDDCRTGTVEENTGAYKGDTAGRSDTSMLVRVDPKNYTITLVTVPRDTKYTLNGSPNKINEVFHQQGITGFEKAVTDVTGAKISYYANVEFGTFEKLIDGLNKVNVNVPMTVSLQDIVGGNNYTVNAGNQTLDGPEALVFARVRKTYGDDMEAKRQTNDRQIIESLIKKVAAQPSSDAATSIATFMGIVKTDFNSADLTTLVNDFAANSGKITIYSGTGPYAGGIDDSAGGLWLVTEDPTTWKNVMSAVDAGKDPNTVLKAPTVN